MMNPDETLVKRRVEIMRSRELSLDRRGHPSRELGMEILKVSDGRPYHRGHPSRELRMEIRQATCWCLENLSSESRNQDWTVTAMISK